VQQIHTSGVVHHLEINPECLEGRVGPREFRGDGMSLSVHSRRSETVHVDIDEWAQVDRQLAHVDTRSPVDIGGPFAGEDADLHGCSVGPAPSDPEV
jgi:hypothetical protein